MKRLAAVVAAGAVVCILPAAGSAVGGDLDLTFSGDGKVLTDVSARGDFAGAIAIQGDGKIVVAGGAAWETRDPKITLVRYNADGTLDTSFGGDGKVTTNLTAHEDAAYGVAIQPGDNKIVVAGDAGLRTGDSRFGVLRYNADGALDTSFGGDGKVTTQLTSHDDPVAGLALQSDGKILVSGGAAFDTRNAKVALVRYNANGTLDTSFSGDGKVITDAVTAHEYANAVVVQADLKIVIGGLGAPKGSDTRMLVLRYLPDGSRDTSFSGDGKVLTDFTGKDDSIQNLAIDADGNIVAAGIAGFGGQDARFALARYLPTGALDTSFSGDGKVMTNFTTTYDASWDVAIQTDTKIVAAGESHGDFALARYLADGSLDTSFSGDGKAKTSLSSRSDFAFGVAIQADGGIVLAGGAAWGSQNAKIGLARYLGS
jgi:uncharacterized delta-60 repeat protein